MLIVAIVLLQLISSTLSKNITEDASTNKTKRMVLGQVQNYGESRPVLLYSDNAGSQTGLTGFYAPVKPVFDPEGSKQVAAQQVLYEFQQTPTNAVSNVHVNQFYQPLANGKQESPHNQYGYSNLENPGPARFLSGSESIANPVQHSSFVRHPQSYGQVQYHPQHIQTHQYIPGKLFYVNGKIIYPSVQNYQKPSGSYLNYHNPSPQKFAQPSQAFRPVSYRRFNPPQPHQYQRITKPLNEPEIITHPPKEEEAEEENSAVKEEEVEENEDGEDKASYEESDDADDDQHFGKYSYDDDDYGRYREEDDEDSDRRSSKTVPKKHISRKTKPQKNSKSNGYKYSENYSSSSKYDMPLKKGKIVKSPSKSHYKTTKYSKRSEGKPRDKFEGKQSQNVPVIHKQKIFKEKWFVTKSTDDSITN